MPKDQADNTMLAADSLTGFVSALGGLGGPQSKGSYAAWYFERLDPLTLQNMYRSNWMARQIIDIPVDDMLREGWKWTGPDAESMQAFEDSVGLRPKLKKGLIRSRLFGGSALIMHDGTSAEKEIKAGSDFNVALVSKTHINPQQLIRDPFDPDYEQPESYTINVETDSNTTVIHRSRVIRMLGTDVIDPINASADFWSDSVLDGVASAINNAQRGSVAIAALLEEAAVDVFGIPNLSELVSTQAGEDKLVSRVRLAKQTKSIAHAMVLDAVEAENYTQKQISFANLAEVERLFQDEVCAAADIHKTRFMGIQASGLSGEDSSGMKNYADSIGAKQVYILLPILMRIAETRGYNATPEFLPLFQQSEKEQAETFKTNADGLNALAQSGEVPDTVLMGMGRDLFGEKGFAAEAYEKLPKDFVVPNEMDEEIDDDG